jgi:hypothetical protein
MGSVTRFDLQSEYTSGASACLAATPFPSRPAPPCAAKPCVPAFDHDSLRALGKRIAR